jgi:hypothetical protein
MAPINVASETRIDGLRVRMRRAPAEACISRSPPVDRDLRVRRPEMAMRRADARGIDKPAADCDACGRLRSF